MRSIKSNGSHHDNLFDRILCQNQFNSKAQHGENHNYPVLCITHLPQIAAMADTHFEIKKSVENGVTATKIRKLTEKDEVDELARLLGGAEITEKVRENAEEMKRLAEETKNHRAVLQTAG